jgi:hypothetical protein
MSVGGPSCGYSGAPFIRAYYDKIYRTYAFREETRPPVLQGTLAGEGAVPEPALSSAASLALTAKILAPTSAKTVRLRDADGLEQKAFTNSSGEWAFFGPLTFPVTVTAGETTQIYDLGRVLI